jgi:single-strand DNA-binding protein
MYLTIKGHAGANPEGGVSAAGTTWARLRVAVTERYLDDAGKWQDKNTSWITVSCFGELARNVLAGVKKGDPVVANGRFTIEEYVREADNMRFLTPTVKADSMGHDMSFGPSSIARKQRPESASTDGEASGDGRPSNVDGLGVIHGDVDTSDGDSADFSADGSDSDEEASESSVSFTTSSPDYSTVGS